MESYPVSEEARQRIDAARTRSLVFEARRILSDGGFRENEIEAIINLVRPLLQSGQKLDRETIRLGLIARQFKRKEADSIASALVPS